MTNEIMFVAFVLLFFFLFYLAGLIADRIVLIWLVKMRSIRVYVLFFMIFFMLGSLFAPDFTRIFLSFMIKSVIATGKMFISVLGDAMNSG